MARKVLICDDAAAPLEAMAYVVRRAGHIAITAQNGDEAVNAAKAHQPDLILLDIDMPIKDGYQVCEEIKADELTRNAHVLILTAFAQEYQKEKARASGAETKSRESTKPEKGERCRRNHDETL